MVLCILGRQPAIGLAELERLYGARSLTRLSDSTVLVDIPLDVMLERPLGGTMKIAEVLTTFRTTDWQKASQQFVRFFGNHAPLSGKLTIGLSAYGFGVSARDVQKTGITIKQKLKNRDGSIRIIPQEESALNTAQVLHNKLGTNEHKKEIIFVKTDDNQTIVAETKYVQDIEAYTFRDRSRPMRDAFVGMLPPKLAQIMINLGTGTLPSGEDGQPRILDPFCGTGVVLQEAALMRFAVYGTDLSEKMIRYSRDNLNWLSEKLLVHFNWYLHQDDATTASWQQPIDAIVCETYLGTPFSAEPSPEKLANVRHDCNTIIKKFLQNLATQIIPGTPLCLAVPAWHTKNGVIHLPVLDDLSKIGYNRIDFTCASHTELIYHREDQIVGRELLVLTRS
jgi:tRNA G10  N-methylase Trm11